MVNVASARAARNILELASTDPAAFRREFSALTDEELDALVARFLPELRACGNRHTTASLARVLRTARSSAAALK